MTYVIGVQIQDIQEYEFVEVFDLGDSILAKHENSQVEQVREATDALDLVVVEVQEDQIP